MAQITNLKAAASPAQISKPYAVSRIIMFKSKSATCFHAFGAADVCNTRFTGTSILKKAKKIGKYLCNSKQSSVGKKQMGQGKDNHKGKLYSSQKRFHLRYNYELQR